MCVCVCVCVFVCVCVCVCVVDLMKAPLQVPCELVHVVIRGVVGGGTVACNTVGGIVCANCSRDQKSELFVYINSTRTSEHLPIFPVFFVFRVSVGKYLPHILRSVMTT